MMTIRTYIIALNYVLIYARTQYLDNNRICFFLKYKKRVITTSITFKLKKYFQLIDKA